MSQTVHVIIHRYTWNGSDWIEDSDSPVDHSYGCYHASCSIAQVIDDEQGPPGTVVAGHQFTLQVQVKNDNTDPSAETIPSTVGGYNFSVTEPPENGNPNYTHNDTGFSLNPPGQPYDEGTVFINFTAPSTAQLYHITLYPDLEPHASLGDDCSVDVPIFQHFNIDPSVSIVPGTNAEDPYIAGSTQHGVSYTVGGSLTEGTTTTATTKGSLTNASGTTVDGEHDTIDTYGTGISRQYNYPISSMNAGDQYCPKVTISPGNGYHGPSGYGDRGDNDATKNGNCLTITNEPYFKAKGAGGLAADVKQVAKPSSSGTFTCSGSSDGGLLAGWNDNADPAGADRGASSELSALALLQITGVASDQPASTVTNSPNKLSFANVGKYTASDGSLKPMPAVSSSLDSPALGGYYGGSGDACVTPTKPADVQAKSSPGATTAVTISSLGGSTPHYEYGSSGSTTKVDFGTDTITKPDTKVFVNGDVYISGKIVYSTSGWSYDPGTKTDSIPSLTLYASGNIYIAAGVTQLDGTYISGGTIYTCGTSAYKACAASSLFNGAKNQLVVNGSFVADQVKLLRTFGSLRDEVPTVVPGSTGLPTNVEWSSCGAYGKPQNGESCLSASPSSLGLTCTAINEPGDPNGWGDNVLCLPNSSSLKLAWTSYAANSCTLVQQLIGSAGCNISSGQANLDYIKSHGYPYCTPWNAPDSKNYGWNDNWLCMNQPRATGDPVLEFSLTNDTSQNCTPISEVADSDGTSDGKQTWAKGYYLCEPKATGPSIVPPTLTKCSNAGTWIDHKTCAAEVFQLSPELYLTEPENNGGNGAGSDDSITSLPPVL
ncbi:MAG TPA: hypothetical protein VHC21_00325 [Candidatus Saccharimonadales bacterium]|nr:hypothetical protein [Candidatus Saccharimonadales bacterium]